MQKTPVNGPDKVYQSLLHIVCFHGVLFFSLVPPLVPAAEVHVVLQLYYCITRSSSCNLIFAVFLNVSLIKF